MALLHELFYARFNMEDTQKWIVDYFCLHCGADEAEVKANLDVNYFQAGYVDSFQFINMVSDIEEEFGIEFDNDQFENRSFSTVNGLANIIEEMMNNAKS